MSLATRKSLAELQAEAGAPTLRRALGPLHLTALGIGSVIGTGIFVLTGTAASQNAGPALVVSMVIAAVGCALAGGLTWFSPVVKISALFGLFSTMLVRLLGQTRIFFSMSRDGLPPPALRRGPSPVPDAPSQHRPHRRGGGRRRRAAADRGAEPAGEHRVAARLHSGLRRGAGAPADRPGGPAAVPGSRGPLGAGAGSAGVPGPDGEPAMGHLGAPHCVAGARSGDLFYGRQHARLRRLERTTALAPAPPLPSN